MTKIKIENVSYVYGAGTPFEVKALDNVNIEFPDDGITGLIGHTGSGKSTLVQLLNGLIKPSAGRILLDGVDIWAEPKKIRDVRFKVGLVMQYPEYQLFEETIAADIAYGPKNMGLGEDEIKTRVERAVEFVGLDRELLAKSPFDLSGGQKRRAAIAGVLAMEPQVLILDEPAAGLDPRGRREILDEVRKYADRRNTSVIIVSHSMEDMAIYCDRLMVMNHGRLCMEGTREEVFEHADELVSMGLDIPQITQLAILLREGGVDMPKVYTVDGALKAVTALLQKERHGRR